MTALSERLRRLRVRLTTKRIRPTTALPVMIICRDRLEPLIELVAWLEDEGLTEIHLVDNDSTYEPLVTYLASTKHHVVRLGRNVGHTSPWLPELEHLRTGPFIVSDCDIVPDPDSHGAVAHFIELLNRYRSVVKVGFGLHIDDLPDHYARRAEVEAWESQFWQRPLVPDVYMATLDTTFALHRPGTPYTLGPALRTGGRFMARHEPWYQDTDAPTQDLAYFLERASSSTTWRPTGPSGGSYGADVG
ncbi:hypothetical protein GCM10023339_06860 [Alloalcanivorax gelatiniphagus]